MLVLKESYLSVLAVHVREDRILHLSLLDVNSCIREHQIESVLVSLIRLITRGISLKIANLEDS